MSMSVQSSDQEEHGIMYEINTTPLVDVMLVLLIIFLITIPIITKTVQLSLPKATNIPTVTKPENITISVDQDERVYWNGEEVATRADLVNKVAAVAIVANKMELSQMPEMHIRADGDVRYQAVGRALFDIQRGGMIKVGFITEPDRGLGRQ